MGGLRTRVAAVAVAGTLAFSGAAIAGLQSTPAPAAAPIIDTHQLLQPIRDFIDQLHCTLNPIYCLG
jgi:hypothetical protein